MFSEAELNSIVTDKSLWASFQGLKSIFLLEEPQVGELSDVDFLALCLMSPSIAVALANGTVSLMEELVLQKKARSLSKGNYFVKKDPLVDSVKALVSKFSKWEQPIYDSLKALFHHLRLAETPAEEGLSNSQHLLRAPYFLVNFLLLAFAGDGANLLSVKTVAQVEYYKIFEVAKLLGIAHCGAFKGFYATLVVK